MRFTALVLVCALSSVALAVPPAPVVTVHASGIKKLTFEWAPVAAANRYELWFKANDNTLWTRYLRAPAPRSSFTTGVAVHLLHWPQARFQLKACDTSGCSTSNTVRVNSEKTVAMGFFKPDTPTGVMFYGGNLALSADGTTMAVVAGELINGNANTAVVYVYRRTTSSWRRENRLVPNSAQGGTSQPFVGDQIALSGDGNLLVFGLPGESRTAPNPAEGTGAVYLFRRTNNVWRVAQKLRSENGQFDYFGYVVKVDDAGQTIAVSHRHEGVESTRGTFEIFRNSPGFDRFVHTNRAPVPRRGGIAGIPDECEAAALSGDGNTMLRACYQPSVGDNYVQALETTTFLETGRFPVRDSSGVDVSFDGTQAVVQGFGEGHAFRLMSGAWVDDGALSTLGGEGGGGRRKVAISRDGKIAVVGSITDMAAGFGPIFEPYQTAEVQSGAVFVHERKNNGWVIRRLVKPGSTNFQWAGHTVALGANGNVLAVGAPFDPSAATGIDGNRHDNSTGVRGAVWLY